MTLGLILVGYWKKKSKVGRRRKRGKNYRVKALEEPDRRAIHLIPVALFGRLL